MFSRDIVILMRKSKGVVPRYFVITAGLTGGTARLTGGTAGLTG